MPGESPPSPRQVARPSSCLSHLKGSKLEATGWSSGYATDRAYTTEFYLEQGPEHLNNACVLSGFEPVPLDRPFTYLELGCGQGVTVTLLAAANPHGRFYGNDFMPAHVVAADQLISAAKLDNLTVIEDSFEAMAQGKADLPQFDFITMHGVYTWVSRENRRHIVDIIARYLKPGGIVYVTYNTLPGWAPARPLHRLLWAQSELETGNSEQRILKARSFVESLIASGAQFFQNNPGMQLELDTLRKGNATYLVHEYLNSNWEPLYHADVAADFSAAKLDFAGSATLCSSSLRLPEAQQRLLDGVPDAAWRETVKNFLLNTRFRKDVFIRGRRPMPPQRRLEWLRQNLLALIVPREQASFGFEWPEALPPGDSPDAVLDALAEQPRSLDALVERPLFGGRFPRLLDDVATVMCDMRRAAMLRPERAGLDNAAALRLNRAIALQSRHTDEIQGLASPLTGHGVPAHLVDRLVYGELVERPGEAVDPAAISARVLGFIQGQGLEADDPTVSGMVRQTLATALPMWRQLKMI